MTKDIPESCRLYLLFLAGAGLRERSLMGTREDSRLSVCLECSFGGMFLTKPKHMVPWGRKRAML